VVEQPIVYGAAYSVYVRTVRLTLWAKSVPYRLVDVDVFAPGGPPPEHFRRHPFGRIPAFEHGPVKLYETAPICRYVEEAFAGSRLQPTTPAGRAVMGQAIAIMDHYAYRSMVWGVYVERVDKPKQGSPPDLDRIATAREQARLCLRALDALAPDADWIAGAELTLADLHAVPMFALFMLTPDAEELMRPHERLSAWWTRLSQHVRPAGVI
jgi:glutathione S-transferase